MVFRPTRNPNPFTQPFAISRGGADYASLARAIPNLIQYLQLTETSGATAADSSGNSCTGAYKAGVILNDAAGPGASMGNAPKFDGGATSYIDPVTAALTALFTAAEGSLAIWAKVLSSAEWTDGVSRFAFSYVRNGNNRVDFGKSNAANTVFAQWAGNGAFTIPTHASFSPTAWFHVAVTWKVSVPRLRLYINGTQSGADASITAWTLSSLVSAAIGARFDAANLFKGWLAHAAVFSRELTQAEITTLATAF